MKRKKQIQKLLVSSIYWDSVLWLKETKINQTNKHTVNSHKMQPDRSRNGKWKCEGKDEEQRIKRKKKK